MTSPSEPRTASLYHAALATAGAAIGTVYAVQIVLALLGAPALAAVAVSLIVAAAVIAVVARRRPGLAGVRRAAPRFYVAALLIGCSLWYLALALVDLVVPSPQVAPLEHLLHDSPLGAAFVAVALLPAIAEELIFRGVLARALARRFGPALAIVVSAAVFGLYHLDLPQLVSTFVLGLALGFIAVRADSALPTMVAHATNNLVVLALSRGGDDPLSEAIEAHPAAALAVAAAVVAAGLALAAWGPSGASRTERDREDVG